MKDIFDAAVSQEVIGRINQLTPETQAQWGKMNVSQMLAHCSVAYQMIYESENYPKNNAFTRFLLKLFVKPAVVGLKPYPKNGRTAPVFLITDEKEFAAEKTKLVDFVKKTQTLGRSHFDGMESHSFGALSADEWNNTFYKHIDHHLTQFGV